MFDCIPARVSLCLLAATGVMVIFVSRVNLSVAIIDMVKIVGDVDSTKNASSTDRLPYCLLLNADKNNPNNNFSSPNEYVYSKNEFLNGTLITLKDGNSDDRDRIILTTTQRGAVLAAFLYGITISAIAGGYISDKYGTKRVFGIAVLADGILNMFIPVATQIHYSLLIILRLLIGIFQGACFPSLHSMMAVWIPPYERSRFMAFAYLANSIGIVIAMPVCGIIIESLGWKAVFYISGAVSFTWVSVWALLMHDRPEDHPRISNKERIMIVNAIKTSGTSRKPNAIPWIKILTSVPLWAVSVAHASNLFGYNLLITQLPTYMSSVIGLPIRENAALSAIPFLSRFFGANSSGWIASFVVRKKYLRMKQAKHIFNAIGFAGPAVALVMVGYVGCSAYAILGIFTLGTYLNGFIIAGYASNHLDIAPNFAGTSLGISETVAYGLSMIAPVVIGVLTPDESIHQWRLVFWITFGIYVAGATFFASYFSVEVQPWNCGPDYVDEDQELKIQLKPTEDEIKIRSSRVEEINCK